MQDVGSAEELQRGDVAIFKELGLLTHQGKKILLVDVTDCSAP